MIIQHNFIGLNRISTEQIKIADKKDRNNEAK